MVVAAILIGSIFLWIILAALWLMPETVSYLFAHFDVSDILSLIVITVMVLMLIGSNKKQSATSR